MLLSLIGVMDREKVHKRLEPKDLIAVNRKPGYSNCCDQQILKIKNSHF